MNLHAAPLNDKESSSNYANETNFQFVEFDKLDEIKGHRMNMNLHPAPRTDKELSSNYANETNFQFVESDKLDDKKTSDENESSPCTLKRQRIVIELR